MQILKSHQSTTHPALDLQCNFITATESAQIHQGPTIITTKRGSMNGIGEFVMIVLMFTIAAIILLPWLLILAVPIFALTIAPFILIIRLALNPLAKALGYNPIRSLDAITDAEPRQQLTSFERRSERDRALTIAPKLTRATKLRLD